MLEVKRTLYTKLPEAPFYRSKLIADGTVLENNKSLSDYPSVKSGCSINVIMQPPWKIYIHDPSSELYEIEIPSDNPKVCKTKTDYLYNSNIHCLGIYNYRTKSSL